jgi:tRNA 2-thiouridine synthesizing protein A
MDAVGWRGRRRSGGHSLPPGEPGGGQLPHEQGGSGGDRPLEATLTIDALGRKCPIPIIMAAEQIRDIPVGGLLALLADDPAAYTDVPSWCRMKSHELVDRYDHATGWAFLIRRSY